MEYSTIEQYGLLNNKFFETYTKQINYYLGDYVNAHFKNFCTEKLNFKQRRILSYLNHHPSPVTMQRLADEIKVEIRNLNKYVNPLLDMGCVVKCKSETDNRITLITISEEMKGFYFHRGELLSEIMFERFSKAFSDTEFKELFAITEKYIELVSKLPPPSNDGLESLKSKYAAKDCGMGERLRRTKD